MSKGYVVVESCEHYEQFLCLAIEGGLPDGGLLTWRGEGYVYHIFPNRKEARAAIDRTHYYAKAYNIDSMPEKKYCKIHVVSIEDKL